MKKEPDILHTVQYVNRNIVTIQKIQQTHRRQMANMCFWNVDFANRIIKKYMISGSYDALSGKMVWLIQQRRGKRERIRRWWNKSGICIFIGRMRWFLLTEQEGITC